MELTYTMQGEYQIPNLTMPEAAPLGKYGRLRRSYLKAHRRSLYTAMLLSQTLDEHLTEIDRTASETMTRLTAQMAAEQGVTEALKATDQMLWVQRMNAIHAAAEEIVTREQIYS